MKTPQQAKKVFVQTFGCQMNEYDSGKMLEQLRGENYFPTTDPRAADLILVNTCAIREKSEHKVFSLLGRLGRIKAARPHMMIGVGGCVAQQKGAEILARAKEVDVVFGTDNLFELPELLGRAAAGERVAHTDWQPRKQRIENFIPDFAAPPGTDNPVKGAVAITKGCNNFCTFCVVPYTRGREVSREPENIVAEAEALVRRGAKEVLLLGQNVNSYKAGGERFVHLLERLQRLPGLARIRYTSPHPKDFGEELARAHRDLPKLCEHLHLPFQSGSDRILQAMRRNHKIEAYREKIRMVRELVPDISLSTDIIVGFPGETEADFQATLEVLAEVRFDHLYAFKFSSRAQTPAAEMDGQVPERTKAHRLQRLLALHETILGEKQAALVGSHQEVLLEGPHPREPGAWMGRTRGNKSVTVFAPRRNPGELVPVEVVATRKFSLVAREAAP